MDIRFRTKHKAHDAYRCHGNKEVRIVKRRDNQFLSSVKVINFSFSYKDLYKAFLSWADFPSAVCFMCSSEKLKGQILRTRLITFADVFLFHPRASRGRQISPLSDCSSFISLQIGVRTLQSDAGRSVSILSIRDQYSWKVCLRVEMPPSHESHIIYIHIKPQMTNSLSDPRTTTTTTSELMTV